MGHVAQRISPHSPVIDQLSGRQTCSANQHKAGEGPLVNILCSGSIQIVLRSLLVALASGRWLLPLILSVIMYYHLSLVLGTAQTLTLRSFLKVFLFASLQVTTILISPTSWGLDHKIAILLPNSFPPTGAGTCRKCGRLCKLWLCKPWLYLALSSLSYSSGLLTLLPSLILPFSNVLFMCIVNCDMSV